MGSNKGQGGIQLLLAAEQEAQHIVASARAAKMARLKQAKDEAEREIASYRAQRETEFRRKVAETSGDSGSNVKRLDEETKAKIEHLQNEASKVSPEVVAMLMKYVTTVRN